MRKFISVVMVVAIILSLGIISFATTAKITTNTKNISFAKVLKTWLTVSNNKLIISKGNITYCPYQLSKTNKEMTIRNINGVTCLQFTDSLDKLRIVSLGKEKRIVLDGKFASMKVDKSISNLAMTFSANANIGKLKINGNVNIGINDQMEIDELTVHSAAKVNIAKNAKIKKATVSASANINAPTDSVIKVVKKEPDSSFNTSFKSRNHSHSASSEPKLTTIKRTAKPIIADTTGEKVLNYNFTNGILTISAPISKIDIVEIPTEEEGKWIGINIPKPIAEVAEKGKIKLTIKEDDKENIVNDCITYDEDDPLLYYFEAMSGGRNLTLEILWNENYKETLEVKYLDTEVSTATITGTVKVGQTLTATANEGAEIAEYQWKIADEADGMYEDIYEEKYSTLVLKKNHEGKFIKVVISGCNSSTATSVVTEAVLPLGGEEPITGCLIGSSDYPNYNIWNKVIIDNDIDFSKITKDEAIKMDVETDPNDNYGIALNLSVGTEIINLNSEKLESVMMTKPDGTNESLKVTDDGNVQFVHDGWGEVGKYIIQYNLKDGRIIEAIINVISFEFKELSDKIPPKIADVEDADVAVSQSKTWIAPTTTATDNMDKFVNESIVIKYKSTDDQSAVNDLITARNHLGTLGNKVTVTYNVSDASGNDAEEVVANFTAVE